MTTTDLQCCKEVLGYIFVGCVDYEQEHGATINAMGLDAQRGSC